MYACGISLDNTYIAFGSESNVVFAKSPMIITHKHNFWVIPYKYSFLYKTLIYNLLNNRRQKIDPMYAKYIIVPWDMNIMHILSHLTNSKALEKAIHDGTKFLKSSDG